MASSTGFGQARRHFVAAIIGSTLLLSGCQTARGPSAPGPVQPGPIAPVEHERNQVAIIVPITGGDVGIGQSLANAAKLALADSQDQSLRLTVYDSAARGGAAAAAERAISDGNRLILGPLLAQDVRAAAPVARRAGVPVVAFSNDEGVAGDGVFIMGFTPDQSIDRVVSHAKASGRSNFAALVPSGLYGQRATQAMLSAVRRSGGKITVVEPFNRSAASVKAAAGRLKAKGNFDAVLIAVGAHRSRDLSIPGVDLDGVEVLGVKRQRVAHAVQIHARWEGKTRRKIIVGRTDHRWIVDAHAFGEYFHGPVAAGFDNVNRFRIGA